MSHNDFRPSFQLVISNLIMRHLYKTLYKYIHSKYENPKNYEHNRRYWPYYTVERNSYGGINKVFFKKSLIVHNEPVSLSKNKCMLVATGPSIKQIPIYAFKQPDIDYFGVNGAIALTDINFKYYVIIDHNFIKNRFNLVLKVLNSPCIFFTTPRCLDLILRKISPKNIQCQIKLIELITKNEIERFLGERQYADQIQKYYFLNNGKGFSKHIQNAVFDYFTVSYVALQVIYSLGSMEIYLAGLDMNNFNQPRFYENDENKQPTDLDQYLDELILTFQVASTFLESKNVKVYNLSPNSAITAFEKISPQIFK